MTQATVIASLTRSPADAATAIERLPPSVDWIEVRADLTGDLDAAGLRERSGRRLLYTRRSTAEGGEDDLAPTERRDRLAAAASTYDLVDLEHERDLVPTVLDRIPEAQRLVSWHGDVGDRDLLAARLGAMRSTPARLYKLVTSATAPKEESAPLALLDRRGTDDVVAFTGGRRGVWTRMLAPRLGARWIYGALEDEPRRPAAPGQPSVRRLVEDFGLPELRAVSALFGVVGLPVLHSLSPRLHNAAYRELDLPYLFLPFEVERFADFWLDRIEDEGLEHLGFPIRGLAVTTPFKEVAYGVAGAASPRAHRLQAVNTLVARDGVWEGESTDGDGVERPLDERGVELDGRSVAVVGAGGAGRAVALALSSAGAEITLVNRTVDRGRDAAERLGVAFLPLADFDPAGWGVVVNATPVGSEPTDPSPVDIDGLDSGATVIDLVYGDGETSLVSRARRRGLTTIDGREVLCAQAVRQFELMTGQTMPVHLCRSLLEDGEGS